MGTAVQKLTQDLEKLHTEGFSLPQDIKAVRNCRAYARDLAKIISTYFLQLQVATGQLVTGPVAAGTPNSVVSPLISTTAGEAQLKQDIIKTVSGSTVTSGTKKYAKAYADILINFATTIGLAAGSFIETAAPGTTPVPNTNNVAITDPSSAAKLKKDLAKLEKTGGSYGSSVANALKTYALSLTTDKVGYISILTGSGNPLGTSSPIALGEP